MGITAIVLSGVGPFEQMVNIPSIERSMWNLVKLGQAVSEKKTLKDYIILNMYICI